MVILANRQRSFNDHFPYMPISAERDTNAVNTRLPRKLDSDLFLPAYNKGEMTPDLKRTLSLSLTLTQWTPLPSQGLLLERTTAFNGLLTADILDSQSRLVTSVAAPSSSARPLTAVNREIRTSSVSESQHVTDRFPRFAYLLRNGTPKPESDEGRSRRSADPGGAQASVATIPDALAQCGIGDETALQSCAAASASGTLSPSTAAYYSSPSRASPFVAPAPADSLASATEDQHPSDTTSCTTTAMANYSASTSPSRSGTRNEQLVSPMRKGADHTTSERIIGEAQVVSFSQNQTSTQYDDADELDTDELDDDQAQDALTQGGGQTPTEGQPRKKKTRRAGVAITRVRRMQREVRRLAEEEEATAQRQQPSLLLGVQVHPTSLASMNAPGRQFQGHPLTGAVSPPPRMSPVNLHAGPLSRPPGAERHARTELAPAATHLHGHIQPQPRPQSTAHSRGPAYNRILEDGDDVVLLRLPGVGRAPGSNIWAYRPEEREQPRGGS